MKRNSRTSQSIRTLKFTTGRTFTLSQETGVYTSHVPYITSNAMLLLVLNEKRFVTQFSVTRFPTHSSRTVTASMTQCNKHDVFPVRTGVNSMIVWHCAQASGSVDPSTDIFKRGSRSPPPTPPRQIELIWVITYCNYLFSVYWTTLSDYIAWNDRIS